MFGNLDVLLYLKYSVMSETYGNVRIYENVLISFRVIYINVALNVRTKSRAKASY